MTTKIEPSRNCLSNAMNVGHPSNLARLVDNPHGPPTEQALEAIKGRVDAAVAAGYAYTEDMNGFQQEGVGPMDMTVHRGRRWSTAMAYLRPALKRPNLRLRTRALDALGYDAKTGDPLYKHWPFFLNQRADSGTAFTVTIEIAP